MNKLILIPTTKKPYTNKKAACYAWSNGTDFKVLGCEYTFNNLTIELVRHKYSSIIVYYDPMKRPLKV